MKLDDLLEADQSGPNLDPQIVAALNLFGFVNVSYSLYFKPGAGPAPYVGIIVGIKSDGTNHTWTGTGNTPTEAEADTIDALSKWILNQQYAYYPTASHTGPGATP